MPISNNHKTNVSRTIKSESKVEDEVKKLAKGKIAEQLGLNKDLNERSSSKEKLPEEKLYQAMRARDVEQAKLAIRNIKELEGQSKEVQVQEAQARAREDVDRATAKANKEIERQMKAQGKELSRRERIVMKKVEQVGGKVAVAAAAKISGKMEQAVKDGNGIDVTAVFLFSLVLAIVKDILDWLINILDVTGIGIIIVILFCFILNVTIGLIITMFMMSVSPHGMIRKRIMKRVARYFAVVVVDSIAVINLLPAMTIYVIWEWFDIRRDTKKKEADLEKFNRDLKRGRINKKMLKQYG